MKSRIILIVLLCVCIIVGIIFLLNRNVTEEKNTSYNTTENITINTSSENYTNTGDNESVWLMYTPSGVHWKLRIGIYSSLFSA